MYQISKYYFFDQLLNFIYVHLNIIIMFAYYMLDFTVPYHNSL